MDCLLNLSWFGLALLKVISVPLIIYNTSFILIISKENDDEFISSLTERQKRVFWLFQWEENGLIFK